MDLIPTPEQVAAAAENLAHMLLYGGLADLRPMPRTLIDDGSLREVYHYLPHKTTAEAGDPVLLVAPLAAPASCYDLRRGCSLVEHLVHQGRPTYVVEYGEISYQDRLLDLPNWVEGPVPEAVRVVSQHAGGRPVHVVGWSLGGVFAVLAAADGPRLPIASLTVLGSPFDVKQVPLVAPPRPILGLTDTAPGTQLLRLLANTPSPVVRRALQLASSSKLITKPLAVLLHLDDAEQLAQIQAVDRFTDHTAAYAGRSFGQIYHRMLKSSRLLTGQVDLSGHSIDLADITAPVLVLAGNTDGIAPIKAVQAVVALLPAAAEVRFEIVPGGHLGMLTGRAARTTTWVTMDEWMQQHSGPGDRPSTPSPPPPPKKTAPRKTAPRKGASKKAAAAKKPAASRPVASKPAASRPVASRPVASRPVASNPAARKPVARKPVAKKPVAKGPVAKRPVAKRPVAGQPAAKRSTKKTASRTPRKAVSEPPATAAGNPERSAIGSNPERRFGSAASRDLGQLP